MTWFPLSDELYSDPRFVGLSAAALALWTRAASWSVDRLTDGAVPTTMLATFSGATEEHAVELVEAGIWKRARGGFQFLDWPLYASRDHVTAKRQIERDRKARQRNGKPRRAQRSTSDGVLSHRDSRGTTTGSPPTRPAGAVPLPNNPSQPTRTTPNGVGVAAPPGSADINPGTVVAAWVDAFEANGAKPSSGMRGQVGRLARELLQAGNPPERVLAAATAAGGKGFATVDRELGALAGRASRLSTADGAGVKIDTTSGMAFER